MKELFTIDLADYTSDMKIYRRPSVRAVIMRDGKLAMIHSLKYDYYKFPGGGIESGETHAEALIREVREETGLTVIPDSIREYGCVTRRQKSTYAENTIFVQENFYYTCAVEDSLDAQELDDYESSEQFTLEYVAPEYAAEVNRTHDHGDHDMALIEREVRVLLGLIVKEQSE